MGMKLILVVVALLAAWSDATLLAVEPPTPCFPVFSPRPVCSEPEVTGWSYWENMQYKYFPKPLSKNAAEAFCKPWDEEICAGEESASNFRAHLGSFFSSGEVEGALLLAYKDGCILNGNLFWIGVNKVRYGKLYYTDTRSTEKNTFPGRSIPSIEAGVDCVAMNANTGEMVITPCTRKLPFICKIQPVSSH